MPGAEVTSAGEVAALRNPLDDLGLDVGAGGVLLDVDERRLAGDVHASRSRRPTASVEIDLEHLAELEPDVGRLRRLESLQRRA